MIILVMPGSNWQIWGTPCGRGWAAQLSEESVLSESMSIFSAIGKVIWRDALLRMDRKARAIVFEAIHGYWPPVFDKLGRYCYDNAAELGISFEYCEEIGMEHKSLSDAILEIA